MLDVFLGLIPVFFDALFFSRGEMRRCIDNRVMLRKNKSPLLEVDLSWLYKNYEIL